MVKIQFQDNITKANADTFNTMQDNIEDAIDEKDISVQNVYSTTETRIGTWIDGKPLYRKVLTLGALKNNAETTVSYDSTYNIKQYDVYVKNPTGGFIFKLPQSGTNYIITFVNTGSHVIAVQTNSDRTAFTDNFVIIEYTKTTD